ncbi:hypothetical protein [Cupriavidus sp. CuC1]|uniref:hypothetical protein n=1 Tax=Cupriavidus sp. CuC1 TaxID=3373131 RepID=UPI0037D8C095
MSNVVEGWHHPTQTAAGALTRVNPSEDANLPGKSEIENSFVCRPRAGPCGVVTYSKTKNAW